MSTFWKSATNKQKLAQIDAAIELGLTAKQCAMNVGTGHSNLNIFANRNGRTFMGGSEQIRKAKISQEAAVVASVRRIAEHYGRSPMDSDVVRINAADNGNMNLFDAHPRDSLDLFDPRYEEA